MQSSITLDVLSAVSEKGFSLDELVLATKVLFEKESAETLLQTVPISELVHPPHGG